MLRLPRSGAEVFVKLLPLTAIELQHRGSTANLFDLPPHYHYRIGSCGFGCWRELEVHQRTTEWVRSGQHPHVPLLYGWRILPVVAPLTDELRDVERWGNHPAIQRRVEAIDAAERSVVLFLERVPQTLSHWLNERLTTSDPLSVIEATEAKLTELLHVFHDQGLLHMDAHFENVLTDGGELFLSDFGLTIARGFQLDAEERAFFAQHGSFDRCTVLTSSVHALVSHYDPQPDDWRQPLRALLEGSESGLDTAPSGVRRYLRERGPVAIATGAFFPRLVSDPTTAYPQAVLQAHLDRIDVSAQGESSSP